MLDATERRAIHTRILSLGYRWMTLAEIDRVALQVHGGTYSANDVIALMMCDMIDGVDDTIDAAFDKFTSNDLKDIL